MAKNMYKEAARKLDRFIDLKTDQFKRGLIPGIEAWQAVYGYIRALEELELIGEGFGAQKRDLFSKILFNK